MLGSQDWYEKFLWEKPAAESGEGGEEKAVEGGKEVEAEKEERARCYDVIVKYRKTEGMLTDKKLQKALRKLQSECPRKMGMMIRLLSGEKNPAALKPVPAREVWKSGISFLAREKLELKQCLVLLIRFAATTRLPTTIHAQGFVESCGKGKGRYPWKAEVVFTDLDREAFNVLKNPRKYLPK